MAALNCVVSWKPKSCANSDVSPVVRFVAVAVTTLPSGRATGTMALNVALPLAPVVTVVEPSSRVPCP